MMTSIGSERARGNRDKAPPATTQTQPQKQVQATAEQIRLAQMIYDKNDADFEDKVKQLMEVTGKNQDECIVALHDCNEDVNRAINILLEGSSDTTSWETVGKKRSLGKEGSENKENREKRGEREPSRGRGGASRRGRGASRSIEFRSEENGVDLGPGERALDRGRRGRGRGSGGRGRGRAAGASRFSAQGMGTFNPADYTESSGSGAGGSRTDAWESGGNDADDGTGAWRNSMDDWTADDWNEDLSETKVFTASSVPATENHITPGQSIDLVALLQKPAPSSVGGELGCLEPSSPQSLGQSLVFTNSHHSTVTLPPGTTSTTTANSYPHHGLSSVLGSGFGELGGSKLGSSAGAQILEQLKGPGLGQLPPLQAGGGGSSGSSGAPGGSGVTTSSWDIKPMGSQTTTALSQFNFKSQPEPSLVLSQLSQRQHSQPPLPLARQPSPPVLPPPPPGLDSYAPSQPKPRDPSPPDSSKLLPLPLGAMDPQGSNATSQHKQIKPQKRRIPPTSKIPSSAVEMPGSADITGLNVQFGALEFGSEPALQEFGSSDSSTELAPQTQNSLYSKPMSEALSSSMAMPLASVESTYTTAAVTSSSMPPTSAAPPPTTSGAASFEQSPPQHSRITFPSPMAPSPAKEPSPAPVTNGFNGVRTPTGLDTTSASSTPKPESPSLPNVGSLSSSAAPPTPTLLPPSAPQHSSALSSLTPELPSASLPQLSSSLSSNHQNSHSSASVLSSSSALTYTSVDCVSSLPPSTASAFSAAPAPVPPSNSSVGGGPVSVASSLHASGALGLTGNGASVPSVSRTAPLLSSSSGKAPPNLPQGVPPLLPNQYIVGPGGLLPAYPIYGYEDLQMLQSRLPMDYYGITFPGPTATLAGRDGSLTNNPYSGMLRWVRCAEPWQINMSSLDRGEVTKFGRGDSASPAPATSLAAQPPQPQSQAQQTHHSGQQAFLNPALPPGYSYTGLPYYPGVPGVPSAFQYGPTMFVPPASAKQHGVGLSTPSTPFQQPSGYSQHSYGSGYDDLTAGTAGGEYGKGGYSGSSQAQAKSAATGPGKGVSVTSSNTGVPDISGSVYNKTQSFDKQGFHAATPPPFSLPSALGGTGPLNPGAAPGYAPAPFLHILPAHQQPHSQLLHHHLQQDSQGGTSQRSQSNSMQQKTQTNKSSYSNSPYWGN
ncbi:ubiquitin-associated protein 2a isoform X2 [Amia ocellicauda]|uniref:ubiquitin-associated protein 2a isoform X2 n=1 Tax=Amia ocellicauda TaxID=2972642 RepID=UPI0034642418